MKAEENLPLGRTCCLQHCFSQPHNKKWGPVLGIHQLAIILQTTHP